MAKLTVKKDDTSRREYVFVLDSASTTGAGKTGIAYNAGGIKAYYVRPGGSATAISLKTQTVTGSYDSGGWIEVDSTNMPGVYRFDIPNAVFATGVDKAIVMVSGASGMAPVVLEYDLVGYDPGDAVRLGLSALPNAAANASGGLITNGTSTGQLNVSNGNITVGGYAANQAPLQPTVSGRTLDVSVGGEAGIDWANIGSPSTTVSFSGSTIKAVTDTVSANTIQLNSQTVTASTGVTFPASVGTSTLTAANVWDTDISGYTTVGYAGTYLKNASAPSAATVADAVWDEVLSGHLTSGSTGAALNAAGSAGDPWATILPGAYGAGTAGKIIGDNINATISSRLASSAITLSSGAVTVGTNNDKTGYSLSAGSITASTFGAAAITNSVLASGAISNSTFASDAIGSSTIASGAITAAALATDAANEIADRVWGSSLTVNSGSTAWANDTFGKSVLRAHNNGNAFIKTTGTGAGHVGADVHDIQDAVITNAAFAAGAIDSNALAASACTEIWETDISGYSTAGYAGTYLKNATSDWTADQRTAIRSALGIPASGTTLTSPAIVLAKTTNITGFNDVSTAQVNSEVDTALSDVGLTTTITGRIDAAISTRSTLAASDVWSNATRTLSSGGNTDISNAVWDATKATWTDLGTKGSTMGYQLALGITPVTPPTESEIAAEIFSTVPTLNTGALTSFGTIIRKINTMMEEVPGSNNQNFRLDPDSLAECPPADSAAIANAVWDELTSENRTAGSYGQLLKDLQSVNYVASSTVSASISPSKFEFTSGLTAPTGAFTNLTLLFTNGSCAGQAAPVLTYNQTNGRIRLETPFTTAPAIGDSFVIIPNHVHGIAEIADGVLDRKINRSGSMTDVQVSTSVVSMDLIGDNLFTNGDRVKFVTNAPTGFNVGQAYFVINAQPDRFQLSSTSGGTAIQPGTASLFNLVPFEDRTVRSAMRYLRNRVQIDLPTSQMKIYREDDTEVAWTANLIGNASATPVVDNNPTD